MDNTFKDHPNLPEFYQTSDGEKFYTENLAKNHASNLEDKSVLRVERPTSTGKGNTAAEIIEMIPSMDVETAKEYLDAENEAKKPRKSVVDALEAHINNIENQ